MYICSSILYVAVIGSLMGRTAHCFSPAVDIADKAKKTPSAKSSYRNLEKRFADTSHQLHYNLYAKRCNINSVERTVAVVKNI